MKKTILLSQVFSQVIYSIMLPFLMRLALFLNPIAIAVVWGFWTGMTLFAVCLLNGVQLHIPRWSIKGVIILYSVCLLILLFFRPANEHYHEWNLIPFKTILFYLSQRVEFLVAFYNLAANIVLFIPNGICILLLTKKRSFFRLAVLPAACISLIEVLQLLTHRGSLDIDDLILNTVGIEIGYWLYPVFKKVIVITPVKSFNQQA
ncbi:VanZ family protein [Heyndrickxia acidicola]|uniref:VanZ family protein n=1 Tax=Heyndrickxia acidicola TaxID=209389 RepID=A0ABU6MI40_9BACI|nr:VanZ family protein [Heyndrickxia acidicola]MED1204338.1 VanZ family protein [Heyndrickxia acidicola]